MPRKVSSFPGHLYIFPLELGISAETHLSCYFLPPH